MRSLILLALLVFTGCQNVRGPLEYREPLRQDDPMFPLSEQERRGRDRLAYPDISQEVGPSGGLAPPKGYLQ